VSGVVAEKNHHVFFTGPMDSAESVTTSSSICKKIANAHSKNTVYLTLVDFNKVNNSAYKQFA
jgi:hypothetical protein